MGGPSQQYTTNHLVASPRRQGALTTYAASHTNSDCVTGAILPHDYAQSSISHEVGSARSKRRSTIKVLRCEVDGCDYKGTFARKYDLERHTSAKHGQGRTFTCGALGCFKRKNQRCTFPRSDKLVDHIRAMHAQNKAFCGCPVDGCSFGPHSLDVLGAHIERAHDHVQFYKNEGRAIVNVTATDCRVCPLPGCKRKLFSLEAFLIHLATHDVKEIYPSRSHSSFESLDLDFTAVQEGTDALHIGVSINIVCPFCLLLSSNVEEFRMHLWASHLFLDGLQGVRHFLAWRDALTNVKEDFSRNLPWNNQELPMKEERSRWTFPDKTRLLDFSGVRCSACTYRFLNTSTINLQHPGLLKPNEQVVRELGPFRMQIRRLYPSFVTHPVFDDLGRNPSEHH